MSLLSCSSPFAGLLLFSAAMAFHYQPATPIVKKNKGLSEKEQQVYSATNQVDTSGWQRIENEDYTLLVPDDWQVNVIGNNVAVKKDFDFASALAKAPATKSDTILMPHETTPTQYNGVNINIREIGLTEKECGGLRFDSCFAKRYYMQYPDQLAFYKTSLWKAENYQVVFLRTFGNTYATRYVYFILLPGKKFIIDVYGFSHGYDQLADSIIKTVRFRDTK